MRKIFIASALTLLMATPAVTWASPQFAGPGMGTDGMGHMQTPEMKASAALSRGLKLKKQAAEEPDNAKRTKMFEKAKEELSKALVAKMRADGVL